MSEILRKILASKLIEVKENKKLRSLTSLEDDKGLFKINSFEKSLLKKVFKLATSAASFNSVESGVAYNHYLIGSRSTPFVDVACVETVPPPPPENHVRTCLQRIH